MKFDLGVTKALLRFLGRPEKTFPAVHVAGSNGKGSTSSLLAAALTASGYQTGLYTSPHLVDFRERIRVDGKMIAQEDVCRLLTLLWPHVEKLSATFFETTTAMAFRYFADRHVDIAVVETGLGGRLDATNVLRPEVSVITNIGREHTQILGSTLSAIAREKAGIIKRGVPCVSGVVRGDALNVIRRECRKRGSRLLVRKKDDVKISTSTLDGITVDASAIAKHFDGLYVSLAGSFQAANVAVALHTLRVLRERGWRRITETTTRSGFARVQKTTGLWGRLTVLRRSPLVIADVAHNPQAMRSLCASLRQLGLRRLLAVFGVMQDKRYKPMIRSLGTIAARAIVVAPTTSRSRRTGELAAEFRRQNIPAFEADSVSSGIDRAMRQHSRSAILLTGSHFVVGEAAAFLQGKKYLTINQ